jgi:hypothetical protein
MKTPYFELLNEMCEEVMEQVPDIRVDAGYMLVAFALSFIADAIHNASSTKETEEEN